MSMEVIRDWCVPAVTSPLSLLSFLFLYPVHFDKDQLLLL